MNIVRAFILALMTVLFGGLSATYAQHPIQSVGFQWAEAPDPEDKPIKLAIWYPSNAKAQDHTFGPTTLHVAMNGAISGDKHPLIVISHGARGGNLNSSNVANTLAEAGFIVVALNHTGDNYGDQSYAFTRKNFVERPRHVKRTLDFMLTNWDKKAKIDPAQIGIFGYSAGGATALISIGGKMDWRQIAGFCQTNPEDWGCKTSRQRNAEAYIPADFATPIEAADPRIKAAVIAAPAITHGFQPDGLAGVSAPLQLWVGGKDNIATTAAIVEKLMPRPIDARHIERATHFDFLAPCSAEMANLAPQVCMAEPAFDRAAFQKEFTVEISKFFQTNLSRKP